MLLRVSIEFAITCTPHHNLSDFCWKFFFGVGGGSNTDKASLLIVCFYSKSYLNFDARAPSSPLLNFPFKDKLTKDYIYIKSNFVFKH